jgi:hypothetical protein
MRRQVCRAREEEGACDTYNDGVKRRRRVEEEGGTRRRNEEISPREDDEVKSEGDDRR